MLRILTMKNGLLLFLLIIVSFLLTNVFAADFNVCSSKYALCTTAKCEPITGKKGWVSCKCKVKEGYSAGTKPCEQTKQTRKGQLIYSRYYPIKRYVVCSNQRPWAWCLDSPCLVDKNNPSKALCKCSVVKGKGDYIIVADTYSKSICHSGIISSALVTDADQITEFLKTQKDLQPFPTKVIKSH